MDIEGIRRKSSPESFMSIISTRHNSSRRNFRRAKNALAYGAAALLGVYAASISSASLFPANAQTITLQTDCKQYAMDRLKAGHLEIGDDALCEIEKNKLAHKSLKKEDELQACLAQLVTYKKQNPDDFAKLGKVSRDNACTISESLPKPTAATGVRPSAG